MTIICALKVWCDEPSCTACHLASCVATAAEVRAESAEYHGWTYTEAGGDRCPEHKVPA